MKLSGHTQPFAVLGHPIGHSLSPVMHNAAIAALGLDAVYLAFDVAPARLLEVLPAMAAMGFRGVNLTVPLKQVAYEGLADLADSARRLGAVNTVRCGPDGLQGHNTDGDGFVLALQEAFDVSVRGVRVFVLGCGGAGRAVAITCAVEGAAHLVLTDADAARAARVREEIDALGTGITVDVVPADDPDDGGALRDAQLVAQCTPVGMRPEDPPLLRADQFTSAHMLFDLVYMYPETAIMREASRAGARVSNGLGMLLHQGARSFEIWTGTRPPADVMRRALELEVYHV